MELNQIEAYVSVIREGNFSRAADKLNLTQPAVSQRIANLEVELGGRLLERSGRRLKLTPLGNLFLPYAKRLMSVLADSNRIVKQYQSGQIGHVAVVSLDNMAYFLLRKPMLEFHKAFPSVDVTIRIGNQPKLLNFLYDGTVALGLMAGPVWTTELQVHAQFRTRVLPVASPNHPLAQQAEPLLVSDLFAHTLFRATLNPGVTAVIEQIAEQARPGSGGAVLWVPAVMVIQLLLENQGIAMLPEYYVQDHVVAGRLVYLDIKNLPAMSSQPTLVSLKDAYLDQHNQAFIQLLRSQWPEWLVD